MTLSPDSITDLGYGLLGLLAREPASGYALRQRFATSPLSIYSDSPGSVYPALRKLDRAGLAEQAPHPTSPSENKRVYEITEPGRAALAAWCRYPGEVDARELGRALPSLMLRFAFISGAGADSEAVRFLDALSRDLATWQRHLTRSLSSMDDAPLTGRLALEAGIAGAEAQRSWARDARARLEARTRDGGGGR